MGAAMPASAKRQGLLDQGDAEVVGSLVEKLGGYAQHAVAVGLGLDHGHDLHAGTGELPRPGEVATQGAQPDLGPRGSRRLFPAVHTGLLVGLCLG